MYGVFDTAAEINSYFDAFQTAGLPLVVGEFGHMHSDGDPDENTIMAQAQARGIGYLGWSWSGNSGGVEYLDQVTNFNVNQLTTWGQRLFNGANGIASTAREATIYSGGSADNTPPSTPGAPSASAVTAGGATLSWAASTDSGGSGLAGYNVYREQGATDPQLGTSATNSINLTGLAANTQYQVYVRARDGAGNLSGNSPIVTFTTQQGQTGGGTCTVSATAQSQWSTGYVMNVTVTNTGTTTSSGWSVPYSLPSGHTISNSWGAGMSGGTATNAAYNGRLGPNQSTSWGFQANRSDGNTQLPTINTCTLT
jgi:mannan endo-1,4-beta-mannosidase